MTTYLKDDFEIDFGLFLSKISMINSKVSSFMEKVSDSLSEMEKDSEEDIEIIEDLGSIEMPSDLFDALFDLSVNLKNQVFFNSIAISIYSFLEFSLIEYCRLIDNYIVSEKPFASYRNYGLDKSKAYLKDNFNIDFGDVKNWEDINNFQKVRNLIVHNNANIIKDYDKSIEEQEDYDVLSKMDAIEITSSGTIFIKKYEYLKDIQGKAVELVEDILSKTKEQVEQKDSSKEKTS